MSSILAVRTRMNTNPFFGYPPNNPDSFWKTRALKQQSAHAFGRSRNCYVLSKRYVLK